MNTTHIPTTLALATAAFIGLNIADAATASSSQATCTLTAQPQDERSYALDYIDANGTPHTLIAVQNAAVHLPPTDFDIPADFKVVRWAKGNKNSPDGYYDHLYNAGGCAFTEPYHAAPGWRASIVIGPGFHPATTSTTVGTTTTSTTPTNSTSPDTTAVPPTVTWGEPTPIPSTTAPDLVTATVPDPVTTAPEPSGGSAPGPQLPVTGTNTFGIAALGFVLTLAGMLALAAAKLDRKIKENQ